MLDLFALAADLRETFPDCLVSVSSTRGSVMAHVHERMAGIGIGAIVSLPREEANAKTFRRRLGTLLIEEEDRRGVNGA